MGDLCDRCGREKARDLDDAFNDPSKCGLEIDGVAETRCWPLHLERDRYEIRKLEERTDRALELISKYEEDSDVARRMRATAERERNEAVRERSEALAEMARLRARLPSEAELQALRMVINAGVPRAEATAWLARQEDSDD